MEGGIGSHGGPSVPGGQRIDRIDRHAAAGLEQRFHQREGGSVVLHHPMHALQHQARMRTSQFGRPAGPPEELGLGVAHRAVVAGLARAQPAHGIEAERRAGRGVLAEGGQHGLDRGRSQIHQHAFTQQEDRCFVAPGRQNQPRPPVRGRQVDIGQSMAFMGGGHDPAADAHHLGQVGIDHPHPAIVDPLQVVAQAAAEVDDMGLGVAGHESARLIPEDVGADQIAIDALAVAQPLLAVVAHVGQGRGGVTVVDGQMREKGAAQGPRRQRNAQRGRDGRERGGCLSLGIHGSIHLGIF